ncbi:MAG: general secretion pathway protein GspK [Proteobacteria bacterium]|nr:general secretion pathway protein GspK [Pseudomonadota bacterium]
MTHDAQRSTRGVTLVIVLWMVAALTILVTGLVATQRSELRLAGVARAQVLAAASGQAAVQLALQQLAGVAPPPDRVSRRSVAVDGQAIDVLLMPLSGLVDLNSAPPALLADVFRLAGGLDEAAARGLAAAVQERRLRPPMGEQPARFELIEELLSLPGVDADLFAKIAPLLTTDSAGSGKVNPLAAPPEVLFVLARGDAVLAQRIADQREAGAIDTTRLEGNYIDATVSSRYRITALVPEPGGAPWAVQRDVDLRMAVPGGPPWRTLRASVRRLPTP